ncbi:hypothetical protein H2248_010631 [Termitomyces sp. 'cryptogamus']|nr:hypothetical protein H2248_010631 [Termitomyces sp. 'cryptogamus']
MSPYSAITKDHPLNIRSKWLLCALFIPVFLFVFSLLRVGRVEAEVKNVEFDIHHYHQDDGATYTSLNTSAPVIPAFSLTGILPVTQDSLSGLEEALKSLLGPSQLREIILLCPQAHAITFQVRSVVREVVSSYPDIPDIRLQTIQTDIDARVFGILAAAQLSGWVLIMDQDGLSRENNHSRGILLQPPALSFPYGPKGICFSWFSTLEPCLRSSVAGFPQEAHHLLPPFVMPAALAMENGVISTMVDPWSGLGEYIATTRTDGIGGVVFGTGVDMLSQAIELEQAIHRHSGETSGPRNNGSIQGAQLDDTLATTAGYSAPGVFVAILPTSEDFLHMSPLLCMLKNTGGHLTNIWIYGTTEAPLDMPDPQDGQFVVSEHCSLSYAMLTLSDATTQAQRLSAWFKSLATPADIILSLQEDNRFTNLAMDSTTNFRGGSVSVRLPRIDLPHTEWMGSLSLSEWKNWNQPRIDISIITNNRPLSFTRLFKSLNETHFYGDTVDLRINVEQSADDETLKIVQNVHWPHGTVFLHHRIVQGGLMQAVVESWYPGSNDTYGLLLEDDVELSPLFYAWAKMSLLRYRYGDPRNRSPLMFGISLYQQKNVELPPEGRHLFNARALFNNHGISDPTTPYLSPIPCSWGAIYFPEHWREFHAYLPLRLSGSPFKLDKTIVPNVRSNKWTKSWKKYFIELVYLRGYVMLYPNYADFVSLSTNHLEVGSHVKVRTLEKQKQFLVPLMETTNCGTVALLDLPGRTLPQWNALPVLNLTGGMATLESLVEVGHIRREELTGCTDDLALFDIHQLLCTAPKL